MIPQTKLRSQRQTLATTVGMALMLALSAACDGKGEDGDAGDDLPDVEYCDAVADWDSEWASIEQQVLSIVNQHRSQGANCGGTDMPAVGSLAMNGALRCAARNHSLDMVERDYFDHTNPDGEGPGPRIDKTGYQYSTWGENIAAGYQTAEQVMDGWMNSPGHCGNIMNGAFSEIGVGYHAEGPMWTQVFGHPGGGDLADPERPR